MGELDDHRPSITAQHELWPSAHALFRERQNLDDSREAAMHEDGSDVVFGLAQLLGIEYRPELADMPDQRSWRIDTTADYGPLNTAARGRIDIDRVRRHWENILRVVASIYTGADRAYDVVRMLQRDGNPTPLGEAIASYGRIFKSLHILVYIDDETYRRDSLTNGESRATSASRTVRPSRRARLRFSRASVGGQCATSGPVCVTWVLRGRSAVVRAAARQDAHDHDRALRDVALNDHAPVTDA